MEAHLRKAIMSVWCVTDGTAGMHFQALALAAIMKWDQSSAFTDIVVKPHPILRRVPRQAIRYKSHARISRKLSHSKRAVYATLTHSGQGICDPRSFFGD